MNKEEFIGKLQMVYVGDRNAFNEIVENNQKLKNLVVYSKVEIDRLNNIINQIKEYLKYQVENLDFEKDTKAKMLGSMILVMLDKEGLEENNNE